MSVIIIIIRIPRFDRSGKSWKERGYYCRRPGGWAGEVDGVADSAAETAAGDGAGGGRGHGVRGGGVGNLMEIELAGRNGFVIR